MLTHHHSEPKRVISLSQKGSFCRNFVQVICLSVIAELSPKIANKNDQMEYRLKETLKNRW